MKTALVIPTRNAVRSTEWEAVLAAYAAQTFHADRKIVLDSASTDDTVEFARRYGWEIRPVELSGFNHGRTRQEAVVLLADAGFDEVIFATQDVLPAPDALERLVDARRTAGAAAAFARQCPPSPEGFDGWMRRYCYPEQSRIKSRADIPALGLATAFCSNALAVWDIARVQLRGGFPATDFGEDMLLAARMILAGDTIVYCAESSCIHGHSDGLAALFRRGRAIGRMHRDNPWLAREFGPAERGLARALGPARLIRYFPALAAKYLGFRWGRHLG